MTSEASSTTATPEGSTSGSSLLPPVNNNRRRSPRSDAEKLDIVCNFMRNELRWGVADLVTALASSEGSNNTRRKAAFVAAAYKDSEVLRSYFRDADQLWGDGRQSIIETLDLGDNELRREVEKLGTIAPFNKFDPTSKNGDFDALDMDQTLNTIHNEAPLLLQLIRGIMAPESRRKYQRQKEPAARIVAIISILCFSQRQNTCTGFQTTLGLYLHSQGVKRQQLELLGQLGLVVSYNTVIRAIKEQSTRAAARVERMGQSDESVTSYDNFEVMEGVKEQRVDHQGTFHSVTTGQVIQGIEIPSGGLRQDMLDSRAEICASDVFLAPGNRDDDINRQISRYFSYEAINTIFSNAIPDAARKQRPAMPVVDVLEPVKTVHCSLGPIPHDESSNAGNILILENIFQHQYHLPDSAFEQRLFLIYGDQKTTQRIRSIKQRREEAQRPCDRLQWALPVPALFHLRMNYLYMISRLHFGGPGSDQSTLYDAMNFWTRKRISKSSADFYALEQLIIHSFQARVCALLWNMLAQSGQGIGLEFEDIARMLAIHDAGTFSQLLDRIVDSYGKYARSTDDEELRNHILFLQHTQTYLLLKYSIKHADLGLLRRAIDRCCVYFHGSGQSRYAFEMLYLQRLTSTRAATPELQRAILANGLVNRQGKADSWYETDRLVKFHNGTLRKLLNAKRGSSLTLDYLFEHCALNTDFFATLAKQTESFYGIHRSSKHPEKSAERDIRVMAQRLSHSRSIALHSGRTVKHKATDVLAAGAMCIAGKAIAKFNRMACSVDYDYLEGDEDELDDGQEDEDEIDEELGHFFAVDHADEE